jgi:predicted Zn-dependent protease
VIHCGKGRAWSWLAAFALLSTAVFLSFGCETTPNPATGRPEVILMTPQQERELDEEEAAKVAVQLGLVQDEALQSYVRELGAALARQSPRDKIDYRFAVVEMDAPNAFALPAGHIYVSRGLLLLTNSEAELANVLGHEIGHVAARHAALRHAHMTTMGLATFMSRLAGGGPQEGESIGGYGGQYAYGRNQEREADRIGMDLAVSAGIDPAGMGHFLRNLDASTRLEQGYSSFQGYLSSHPATPERIAETSTAAEARSWTRGFSIAPTSAEYLAKLDGMTLTRPGGEGLFLGTRFMHPEMGFSVRFPKGWTLQNQNTAVIGISPKVDAMVALGIAKRGDDPEAVALEMKEERGEKIGTGTPVRIGELEGYRAQGTLSTPLGPVNGEVTYVAFDGHVYRLVAGVDKGSSGKYVGTFRNFARSFRRMAPEEREDLSELRVRIAVAEGGESLSQLGLRERNEWDPNETAVANGLRVGEPLRAGQLVKIARREPFDLEPLASREVEAPPLRDQ